MLPNQIPAFRKTLLAWYQKNARDLPWRRTKDPYAIWVSEIMLQQTQVKTVIPYYEKWMRKFPTVKALAKAPLNEVLKLWAGLGYYRRARMLHQAAQTLAEKCSGKISGSAEELQKIPGIGRYTAGAIASIAFGEKVPVLDGNVVRILTRMDAFKGDIGSPKTIAHLWETAGNLLTVRAVREPPLRFSPGDFNQALMELGATVCSPQGPACLICPVVSFCEGSKRNPEHFPVRKKKESLETLKTAALILRNKTKVLVQKQAAGERWGGLWVFPHWKDEKGMLKETGLLKKDLLHRMTVKHGFTKYRITLKVYEIAKGLEHGTRDLDLPRSTSHVLRHSKWLRPSKLKSLPFPSPHQKIAAELLKGFSVT